MCIIEWQQSSFSDLTSDELHIWSIDLYAHQARLEYYQTLLNYEEGIRANRFKFDKDRICFIISRASLRILLGRYLHCLPNEMVFHVNQHGKPTIMLGNQETSVHFSLSHSEDRTLIAVIRNHIVGVDVEYMEKRIAMDDIVEHYFSKRECDEYNQLPETQKLEGFYNAWTRKEAFTKAIGQGITYPLKQFDVNLTPKEKARLLSIQGNAAEAKKWSLCGFIPEKDYCAAVSWLGGEKNLLFYQFSDLFS